MAHVRAIGGGGGGGGGDGWSESGFGERREIIGRRGAHPATDPFIPPRQTGWRKKKRKMRRRPKREEREEEDEANGRT